MKNLINEKQRAEKNAFLQAFLLCSLPAAFIYFLGETIIKFPIQPIIVATAFAVATTTIAWGCFLASQRRVQLILWTFIAWAPAWGLLLGQFVSWPFWILYPVGVITCLIITMMLHVDTNKLHKNIVPQKGQ